MILSEGEIALRRVGLDASGLQKAEISVAVEDDVIKKLNAENLSGLFDLLCSLFVSRGWIKVACRVIVRDYDAGCPVRQNIGEDLTWMNRAAIYQAYGNHSNIEYFVCSVDCYGEEMFLLAISEMSDQRENIGGGCNLYTIRFDTPPGKLNGRKDQRSFRFSDAVEADQIIRLYIQSLLVNDSGELACQSHYIHLRCPFPQQNGEKFLIGERRRAFP